jgi:hypothetical protein
MPIQQFSDRQNFGYEARSLPHLPPADRANPRFLRATAGRRSECGEGRTRRPRRRPSLRRSSFPVPADRSRSTKQTRAGHPFLVVGPRLPLLLQGKMKCTFEMDFRCSGDSNEAFVWSRFQVKKLGSSDCSSFRSSVFLSCHWMS